MGAYSLSEKKTLRRIKMKSVRDTDVPTWPTDTEYMVHMALALRKKEPSEGEN